MDLLVRRGHRIVGVLCSDIHMGDGSTRDDYRAIHKRKLMMEVEALLPLVRADRPIIVLDGDIVDEWRYRRDLIFRAHGEDLKMIADKFGVECGATVYWVLGNHDEGITQDYLDRLGVAMQVRRMVLHKGWVIEHGHQYDPEPTVWRKVGKVACNLLAKIGKYISPKLEDKLSSLGGKIDGTGSNSRNKDRYESESVKAAQAMGYNGAILGHTHRAVVGLDYINTGKWSEDGWSLLWDDGLVSRYCAPYPNGQETKVLPPK